MEILEEFLIAQGLKGGTIQFVAEINYLINIVVKPQTNLVAANTLCFYYF